MKIGILGFGSMGRRHAKNFELPLGCAVGIYDASPAVSGWRLGPTFEKRSDLIAWADAIVIATPSGEHYKDILDCDAAKKPMLVEKPLTLGVLDVPTDYIKMVGYNLRYHHCVQRARSWLGRIGQPQYAYFICRQSTDKAEYKRDGVIYNYSHEIDLALYLMGAATAEWSMQSHDRQKATLVLNHNGVFSVVVLDALADQPKRRFIIGGSGGFISCDLIARTAILFSDFKVDEFSADDTFDDNYVSEALAFLGRLEGKEVVVFGCTAEEALRVVRICNRAEEMCREEGA